MRSLRYLAALIVLFALSFVAGPAYALSFPPPSAPLTVTLDPSARVCLLFPKPTSGACEDTRADLADSMVKAFGATTTLHGIALMRYADGSAVFLTETEFPREGYGPGVAQSKQLVSDFTTGLGSKSEKLVGEPRVSRVGDVYSKIGLQLHVSATTAPASGPPMHYTTVFIFGESKIHVFSFFGRVTSPTIVDGIATRVMSSVVATSAFKSDAGHPRSSAEALGRLIGFAVIPLAFVIGLIVFLVRRKPARPPYGGYGYPQQGYPPPPPQMPYGYPPSQPPPPQNWPPR